MTESIVVDNATKQFTMRYHRTIKQITIAAMRRQAISDNFDAVKDVSFTIEQGESVGLMGLNGSGQEHAAQADQRRDEARPRVRC